MLKRRTMTMRMIRAANQDKAKAVQQIVEPQFYVRTLKYRKGSPFTFTRQTSIYLIISSTTCHGNSLYHLSHPFFISLTHPSYEHLIPARPNTPRTF